MSIKRELFKTRAYFTQIQDKVDLRCIECVRIKKWIQHCKIFHSFPSLWYHVVTEHGEISNSEFRTSDIFETLNNIAWAIQWKMFPNSANITIKKVRTTTSSLIFDGKQIIRSDVWDRLERIARVMKLQSTFYPNFRQNQIFGYIKVIASGFDKRTRKKYFDCIVGASKKDFRLGTIDVSGFCNKMIDTK